MSDLTDRLRLEIESARSGVFVWNISTWDGYRFAGSSDKSNVGTEWLNVLGETNNIRIKRGGESRGLFIDQQAGDLSAVVLNPEIDPSSNPYFKPGTPIRLVYGSPSGYVTEWLGSPHSSASVLKQNGEVLATNLLPNPAMSPATYSYGNLSLDYSFDELSLREGSQSFKTVRKASHFSPAVVGRFYAPFTYPAYDVPIPEGATHITASIHIRPEATVRGRVRVLRWTTPSAYSSLSPSWTTLPGGEWTRVSYTSSVVGSFIGVSIECEVETLDGSDAPTGFVTHFDDAVLIDSSQWPVVEEVGGYFDGDSFLDVPVFTGVLRNVQVTYPKGKPRVVISAIDRIKDLSNTMRYGADENSLVDRCTDLLAKHGVPHVFKSSGGAELVRNSYSSSLLNHLNLAVNSDSGRWYVGKDNQVWISPSSYIDPDPLYVFTDKRGEGIEYNDISVAYDSADLVNELEITNLTHDVNEESEPVSVHTNYGPFKSAASVATFGVYGDKVETNIDPDDIADYAAGVLSGSAYPKVHVSSIRANLTDSPEVAAGIEVDDLIGVEYSNEYIHIDSAHRVLNIEHEITASNDHHKWMVNLNTKAHDAQEGME